MTSTRIAGLGIGLVFGVVLSWSGMTSPEVIREALLFEDSYLFLFFGSAVLVGSAGLALLRRTGARALLTGGPVGWMDKRPARRHVVGSVIFGVGWGIADACPGPVATQVGQGIAWGLCTLAGVLLGVYLFMRRSEETEPADERLHAGAAQIAG
jgi:uncharacterized membrane protein YedE/YeeE